MDRRGWPWKKKTSDKTTTEKTVAASGSDIASLASVESLSDKENYNINYVQVSLDSYTRMTGFEAQVNTLEGKVKILEDQIKDTNKKLSEAHSEITRKESLIEQHIKVAEEAVSGWERADAEALALKLQLESIKLLQLTAEDRASHLDAALKECVRQLRCVKEESEQRLHEVILTKSKQWEKIKLEFEGNIVDLDQERLMLIAQNAAISRSLQEHSNMLTRIKEEKFQAEANIEHLKENIQSYEKEINSLKYELHIASKEFEIRNEEKDMSLRLAEVANKQNLEAGKKIAKLEAECQRLRCLVRKKLPGPAALAQMKLEVENFGEDFGEPQARRTPLNNPNLNFSQLSGFSNETLQQNQKTIEFLTTRLLAMEDETKMLKEALAARNQELQTSRSMCAEVASRLKSLEAQQDLIQWRSSSRSNYEISSKGSSSHNASDPASAASVSDDGIGDEKRCVESSGTSLISDLPHFMGNKSLEKSRKHDHTDHLAIMDDFLEMERSLAQSSRDVSVSIIKVFNNIRDDIECHTALSDVARSGNLPSEWPKPNQVSSSLESSATEHGPCVDHLLLLKLQSRISIILDSQTKNTDAGKILDEIKFVMLDVQDSMHKKSASCFSVGTHLYDASYSWDAYPQDTGETKDNMIFLGEDGKPCTGKERVMNQNLVVAVSQIYQYVLSLGKEAVQVPDTSTLRTEISKNIEDFTTSVDEFLLNKISLVDFFLGLSHILAKANELKLSFLDCKDHKGEITAFECIDKVGLLENKVVNDEPSREGCPRRSDHNSGSTSDPEILQEDNLTPGSGSNLSPCQCSIKDLEQLQSFKDKMEKDLAMCTQDLENTRLQLKEMERRLEELKLQLALSQKSTSLAETQLRCMTESYESLELHSKELEAEVRILQEKMEDLNHQLRDEKNSHQDALARCEDFQEQLHRVKSCPMSLLSTAASLDVNSTQEREIAAAAYKLVECQETIDILDRQLKSLQTQTQSSISSVHQAEMLQASPTSDQDTGEKLPHFSHSPSSPSQHHHKPTKPSKLAPEKHLRGFSSFFATRGKKANDQ